MSFSAVMTLKHAGVKTVAMICDKQKHQTVIFVPTIMKLLYRFKFLSATKIIEIQGDVRVTGVKIEKNGKESIIKADTIIFTGDWIPDHELARRAGFAIDDSHKSPITNNDGQIPNTTIYTVGNLILPIKGADKCAIDARKVARKIAKKIK